MVTILLHGDCTAYLKVVKTVDYRSSHHKIKKNILTVYGDGC